MKSSIFKRPVRARGVAVFDHAYPRAGAGMMTYDNAGWAFDTCSGAVQGQGFQIAPGRSLGRACNMPNYRVSDGNGGHFVVDQRVYDSTGAFLVGELERLDLTEHPPLAAVTWGRDIDLREDVTLADEISSFTVTTYGSQGGAGTGNSVGNGKAWAGKAVNQPAGIGIDLGKIANPLNVWMMELKYDILELESAAKLGRPIDQQKYNGLMLKQQMDIDEQVYIGDTGLNLTGLVNASLVTNVNNVVNGVSGSPLWTQKTPDEILSDFNTWITSVWTASGVSVMPENILISPTAYSYITMQKVSLAGNVSILKYVKENNILTASQGRELNILPLKWCAGAGVGGTILTTNGKDRAVVYTKDKDKVRFPMTQLQRTPVQFDSIFHKTTYFNRLGVVEVVYPETIGYFDGYF